MKPRNPRQELAREALRLHERYHRELIERFAICPWAKPARADGRTRTHVVVDASCKPRELGPMLADWIADESVEVGFIIAPRFTIGLAPFTDWATAIADEANQVFLTAPFYPRAGATAGSIQFLRQAPDPTVQLVRRARLEEIRSADPPHYRDIFDLDPSSVETGRIPRTVAASILAHNERKLEQDGRAEVQAILDDIREDRDRTYARLFPLL